MFKYKTQIRLHHTDAAGLLFFANQLVLAHDAYEMLLDKMGFTYERHLRKGVHLVPIVHAESNYKKPLFVGDQVTYGVTVANIGTSSFTLHYKVTNKKGDVVGTAKTVHVAINRKTKKKIPLPNDFRAALEKISG